MIRTARGRAIFAFSLIFGFIYGLASLLGGWQAAIQVSILFGWVGGLIAAILGIFLLAEWISDGD